MTKPLIHLTLTDQLAHALDDLYNLTCQMPGSQPSGWEAEAMEAARAALRRYRGTATCLCDSDTRIVAHRYFYGVGRNKQRGWFIECTKCFFPISGPFETKVEADEALRRNREATC